jgi:esterase/lipase superfamily enzyme
METTSVRLPVPGHDGTLEVVRHGSWGRPVLLFPSEAGSARDAEHNGTLDAVRGLVDAGRMSLFCVDSLDGWSWSDSDLPTEERARRGQAYAAWLSELVLPWITGQVGEGQEVVTVGVSLGAYHAVHLSLRRADVVPLAIGLSGSYDPSTWNGWGETGDATYFANPMAYVANMEGEHLEWVRSRVSLLLVVGQGAFEESPTRALSSTRAFADLLSRKGIRHELDEWGHDSSHDWPWWHRQLAHHLPRFV